MKLKAKLLLLFTLRQQQNIGSSRGGDEKPRVFYEAPAQGQRIVA
jgi:hypothetical protein